MRFVINSRKHGPQEFWANMGREKYASTYVYLTSRGRDGCTGQQICYGGGFRGSTVMCNGTEEGLERAARKWWRQRMR